MLLKTVNFTGYHLIRRTLVSTEVFFMAASSLFLLQVALGLDDDVRKRKKLMQDLQ